MEALNSPETWEDAKAHAQERMLAVFDSITDDRIERVDQNKTGTLISCGDDSYQWIGSTEVFFVDGEDPAQIVRSLEGEFESTGYEMVVEENLRGDQQVQLIVPGTPESYLFSKESDASVRVQAGSACFTLPEDVWPGGTF